MRDEATLAGLAAGHSETNTVHRTRDPFTDGKLFSKPFESLGQHIICNEAALAGLAPGHWCHRFFRINSTGLVTHSLGLGKVYPAVQPPVQVHRGPQRSTLVIHSDYSTVNIHYCTSNVASTAVLEAIWASV